MDHQFCPGAALLRRPVPEIFDCPSCGSEVEIWTDEFKGACPSCGKVVFRDAGMGCLEWCKQAEECVGTEELSAIRARHSVGVKDRLLEKLADTCEPLQIQRARRAVGWAEQILQGEEAGDWHLVIPSVVVAAAGIDAETAQGALVRSRVNPDHAVQICQLSGGEDTPNGNVLHDALALAAVGDGSIPQLNDLRTSTGRNLAMRLAAATPAAPHSG